MWLAYFDESGDSGHPALVNTPTRFFVLAAVVLPQDVWLPTLDRLIVLRRSLRDRYDDSYLVQVADWNAIACHRSRYVDPRPRMPDDWWELMPTRHRRSVNELTGGWPGIVIWPR